jgi:hypothetical protein
MVDIPEELEVNQYRGLGMNGADSLPENVQGK